MTDMDSVMHHVYEAIRSGFAELDGDRNLAQRLNAETKLRLLLMSDEELLLLAKMLATLPGESVEVHYRELKQIVEEHRRTAGDWIPDLGKSLEHDGEEEQDGR